MLATDGRSVESIVPNEVESGRYKDGSFVNSLSSQSLQSIKVTLASVAAAIIEYVTCYSLCYGGTGDARRSVSGDMESSRLRLQ